MDIPKEFYLFAQKIEVEFNNTRCIDQNALGMTKDCSNRIILSDQHDGELIPADSIEQTFVHELVHQILYKMSEYKLSANEKFTDLFSKLLHQYLITAK